MSLTIPQDGCHCQSRGPENLNPIQQQPVRVLHLRLVFPPWYEASIAERPAAAMRYSLEVGNMKKSRQTAWDGTIVETVPAAATSGKLTIPGPRGSLRRSSSLDRQPRHRRPCTRCRRSRRSGTPEQSRTLRRRTCRRGFRRTLQPRALALLYALSYTGNRTPPVRQNRGNSWKLKASQSATP